ncbi:MAG TPA: long-chain fatty acid--CoA ligase [Candidatus Rubrimentiphilum sp.]|nr:long-chain fatty acid--CoA ligase [Candidatus Rubrimentiphilum sp.]
MDPALAPRETLPAMIRRSLSQPRDGALFERVNGNFTPTSSQQLLERVENLACAIRAGGAKAGDRIALMSANCVDWIVTDFAILFSGSVVVPIFPTQARDQVGYILRDSEAKHLFVDTPQTAERVGGFVEIPVTIFQGEGPNSLRELEARGAGRRTTNPDEPRVFEQDLKPDDLAVLIYTSGTTGEPKGVMLSHYNIAFNAQSSFSRAFDVLTPDSNVLSILTFAHIYEHSIVYGYMHMRVHHYIAHSVEELLADLREVHPVVMTAVPRVFERMIAGIIGRAKTHGGLQAKLVPWALDTGRDYMAAKVRGRRIRPWLALRYSLAHALVLRKIRPALGLDRLKFLVSGSAPLHFDTAMLMLGCDIPIVEGYGPTECSPVVTVNTFNDNHYGTVGKPIPGVEIHIAADGEILVRGPSVMLGYYKDEVATAQALRDGWYHTGDIGEIDAGGNLRITDRKNELFKTSGGKFIAPARVEAAILRSVYVNQALIVGEGRAHPVALVSPNWPLVRMELGISENTPPEELAKRADVVAFLTAQVREQTNDLATFEQIRRVAVLPRDLTIEDGELSPSLKVKRRIVERRYAEPIGALYAEEIAHA